MTPTQIELHNAHKARLQRIAAAAARVNPKTDSEFSAALNEVEEPAEPVQPQALKEPWFYNPSIKEDERYAEFSITEIRRAVCSYFGMQLIDIRRQRRLRTVVRPRQIAMYLCRNRTIRSLPEIARMFGGYDHTTVLHACRVIEEKIKSDWLIAYDVAHIERLLA